MLHYIDYENTRGDKLRISDGSESQYIFYDIDGVSSPDAAINTESTAGYDGSTVVNTSVGNRNIVITVQIAGDATTAKKGLYKVFQVKKHGTLYYKSDGWDVKIPCYTEKLEIVPTAKPLQAVISLICPQPYFEALESIKNDLQSITDGFYFPLVLLEEGIPLGIINQQLAVNVVNDGDVDLGMIVEFRASGAVSNPKLINTQTLEYIQIEADMIAGDLITVCTENKKKRVTLLRNGVESNYFNYLADGSTFLRLEEGDNEFQYTADGGESNLFITIRYTPYYTGV
ncbi:MAG: phage tail family protein [Lachnospiraceae bacterium]